MQQYNTNINVENAGRYMVQNTHKYIYTHAQTHEDSYDLIALW